MRTAVDTIETESGRVALPKGWRWMQLRDVCEQIDYGYTASANRQIDGPKFLRITDIQNGHVTWENVPSCSIDTKDEEQKRLVDGDIVFARTGGTTGKSFLIKQPPRAVFASYLIRLRATHDVEVDYLYAFFQSPLYWAQIRDSARGAAQPNVNATLLGKLRVPIPPKLEQRRIAAKLKEKMAAMMQAKSAAADQVEAASLLVAAKLRELFNQKPLATCRKVRLGEICRDISDGTHFTPLYTTSGIPFLSVKDIREHAISFDSCKYISEEEHKQLIKRCKPEMGDVLYTKVGTTGIAKQIDIKRDFSIFVSVALLKPNSEITSDYLETVLNSPIGKTQAANLTQGMANRNLVLQDIKKIEIPLPSSDLQAEIAITAKQLRRNAIILSDALFEQCSAMDLLRAALLRQAFNGEF